MLVTDFFQFPNMRTRHRAVHLVNLQASVITLSVFLSPASDSFLLLSLFFLKIACLLVTWKFYIMHPITLTSQSSHVHLPHPQCPICIESIKSLEHVKFLVTRPLKKTESLPTFKEVEVYIQTTGRKGNYHFYTDMNTVSYCNDLPWKPCLLS